jgi:hypothetical protein
MDDQELEKGAQQETLTHEAVKDGINKIDAIDTAEAPSRTKLSAIISRTDAKKKKPRNEDNGFYDNDGIFHEKKVGFLNLTINYFIK